MVSYTYRMPSGIPGNVTRIESATIVPEIINPSTPPVRYGDAVVLTATGVRPVGAGDTASLVYGSYVRPYPTTGGVTWPNSSLNTTGPGTPPVSGICDILKRGYMTVYVGGATAATKGGVVYIRIAASPGASQPVGGYEAAADGANTIVYTGAAFMGPQDAQGMCEISIFAGPHQ